ncbi:unnamed protein product, partial [marine sediment metagenome]
MKAPNIPTAPFYCLYLERIKKVANDHGYAMTLHGSMNRDCDICLVPWTNDASNGIQVMEGLCDELGVDIADGDPELKPHGRKSYTLALMGTYFFDVSVLLIKNSD